MGRWNGFLYLSIYLYTVYKCILQEYCKYSTKNAKEKLLLRALCCYYFCNTGSVSIVMNKLLDAPCLPSTMAACINILMIFYLVPPDKPGVPEQWGEHPSLHMADASIEETGRLWLRRIHVSLPSHHPHLQTSTLCCFLSEVVISQWL